MAQTFTKSSLQILWHQRGLPISRPSVARGKPRDGVRLRFARPRTMSRFPLPIGSKKRVPQVGLSIEGCCPTRHKRFNNSKGAFCEPLCSHEIERLSKLKGFYGLITCGDTIRRDDRLTPESGLSSRLLSDEHTSHQKMNGETAANLFANSSVEFFPI
jgi:hypothetical protein